MNEKIEFQPFIPQLAPNLRLSTETPHTNLESVFEEFADNLASSTRQVFPVDIDKYLKEFLIVRLSMQKMFQRTGLTWDIRNLPKGSPNYYHVEVSDSESNEEKRFTLAHEMGHIFIIENDGLINLSQTTGVNYPNEEDIVDRFGRALLAPKSLLLPELIRFKEYDPVALIAILHEKMQIPPYMIAERLVKDLHLLDEDYIVFTLGNDYKNEGLWTSSQNPNLNVSNKDPNLSYIFLKSLRAILSRRHYIYVKPPINEVDLETLTLTDEDVYVIIKSDQNEDWLNVHRAKLGGINIGQRNDGKVMPEFGVCTLNLGEKIAETQKVENLSDFIVANSLRFA